MEHAAHENLSYLCCDDAAEPEVEVDRPEWRRLLFAPALRFL